MKYIKKFETINDDKPQIDDYVICDVSEEYSSTDKLFFTTIEAIEFISKNIGYIWKIPNQNKYLVKYFNIPENLQKFIFHYSDYSKGLKEGNSIRVDIENIKFWSKNKEELIPLLKANNYNL